MQLIRFAPVALAASILVVPAAHAQEASPVPRIVVQGEGEAFLRPDMANVRLSVMREAETAREALDQANSAMSEVIDAMRQSGIEARDLQTSGLNIQPRYVYPDNGNRGEAPRIVGYQVTNMLNVRVRDIERVGEVVDQAVTLGVNQGGDISFTNEDPASAQAEARRRAVEDALAKAGQLADAAGVDVGRILEIAERGGPRPPMPFDGRAMRMEAQAADSVPVEPGENSYTVQVDVTFELDQQP